jgi:hypothetical protein
MTAQQAADTPPAVTTELRGRPRGIRRLTRALGLDRNPLRRACDRAEAWSRVGPPWSRGSP